MRRFGASIIERTCDFLLIIFTLALTVAVFSGAWLLTPAKYSVHCRLAREIKNDDLSTVAPFRFAERGDITSAPENTVQAGLDAVMHHPDYGVSINVETTADGIPMVLSDKNLTRLTGVNRLISDVPFSSFLGMNTPFKLLTSVNGHEYPERYAISSLQQYVNAFCRQHLSTPLMVQLPAYNDYMHAHRAVSILKQSSCSHISYQHGSRYPELAIPKSVIIITSDLQTGKWVKQIFPESILLLRIHPGKWSLGIFFWLKTELAQYLTSADGVATHFTTYDRFHRIFQYYRSTGYCLGVYGGNAAQLLPYGKRVDMLAINVPGTEPFYDHPNGFASDNPRFFDKSKSSYDLLYYAFAIITAMWFFAMSRTFYKVTALFLDHHLAKYKQTIGVPRFFEVPQR